MLYREVKAKYDLNEMSRKVFIWFLAFFCLFAQLPDLQAQDQYKLDSAWNNWKFRISPYFWLIGFKGTIYRPPQPTQLPNPPPPKYDIDVGFKDIRNSIKFALMLSGQYRNKHIITQFNLSSLILESEAITPKELLLQNNIINLTYFGGDFGFGYRAYVRSKFEVDALLGLKFIYFKIGLSTNLVGNVPIQGERSKLYIDPVIGTNLIYRPHPKVEFVCYADIGPQITDNVKSYQVALSTNYFFTKTFSISTGYRFYHVDFPKDEAIFIGNIKGWIMRLGFQF